VKQNTVKLILTLLCFFCGLVFFHLHRKKKKSVLLCVYLCCETEMAKRMRVKRESRADKMRVGNINLCDVRGNEVVIEWKCHVWT